MFLGRCRKFPVALKRSSKPARLMRVETVLITGGPSKGLERVIIGRILEPMTYFNY